jgi:hypothetical protein
MKAREQARLLAERERLLEIEAQLQRTALAATFTKWQEHRLLAVGSTLASWSWRLLSVPRVRWLVAGSILARLRKRRKH